MCLVFINIIQAKMEYNDIFFSIIIPVYNVEKYVRDCLESILKQTFTSYEIICVNDGSTDKSGEICDVYQNNNLNLRVFHKQNEGLGLTRNYGVKKARGEYIFFIDSDDFLPDENCLKRIYEKLKNEKMDMLNINFCSWSFETKKYDYSRSLVESKRITDDYFVKDSLFTPSACMKICKKEFLQNSGILFETGISEDYLWTAKLLKLNPHMGYLYDHYSYCYRNFRQGSLTQSKRIDNLRGWNRIYKEFYKMSQDNCMNSKLDLFLTKSYFELFMTFSKQYQYEDIKDAGLVETIRNTNKLLVKAHFWKSGILYCLIKLLGIKNTIRIIKIKG